MSNCCKKDSEPKLSVVYDRDVHTVARHRDVKQKIPLAGHCDRAEFNPLDLLGLSLGACMLNVMGQVAKIRKLDMVGARATVSYVIEAYRVESIAVKIEMPKALAATDRKALERASKTCPVYRALDPQLKVCVEYAWPGVKCGAGFPGGE